MLNRYRHVGTVRVYRRSYDAWRVVAAVVIVLVVLASLG